MTKYIVLILSILLPLQTIGLCYAQKPVFENEKEYVIATGDVLEISVYGEPDLSTTVRVSQDGSIAYPLIGNLQAAGYNVRELEKQIESLLEEDYLVIPQVSIFVKEYARISLLGAVKSPGSYEIKENFGLTQAIAIAGGFSEGANTSRVKVIRNVSGKKETLEVNVDRILNKTAPDLEMKPNDIVTIEEYGRFSIMGQVMRPGVYNLRKGLTAVEAIGIAGGFTTTAAQNGVRIVREVKGQRQSIRVPIASIMREGDKNRDVLIKEGDTIVVPESFF